MTEPIDIDALIAEARDPKLDYERRYAIRMELADALESAQAELRQERERADVLKGDLDAFQKIAGVNYRHQGDDLAQAREVIEKMRTKTFDQEALLDILDAYDQAERSRR